MAEQAWIKSSYSGSEANCVEVARGEPRVVAVRDSKDPDGPKLVVAPEEWRTFTASVKAGRHDVS